MLFEIINASLEGFNSFSSFDFLDFINNIE